MLRRLAVLAFGVTTLATQLCNRAKAAAHDLRRHDDKQPFAIHFSHSLTRQERSQIQAEFGLELDSYLPKFTYIELADDADRRRLQRHPLVRGVSPIPAQSKLAPGLGRPGRVRRFLRADSDISVRAMLFGGYDIAAVQRTLEALGAKEVRRLDTPACGQPPRLGFQLATHRIGVVAGCEEIRCIEEESDVIPNGGVPSAWLESGPRNATPISASGLRGLGQIVGVIDVGVLSLDHCWFRDNANNIPNPAHRKVVGYRDQAKLGDTLHPAFVAGILAGDDGENLNAGMRGIACDARLTYGNSKDIAGRGAPATLYDYLWQAMRDGAFIHNCSWHLNAKPPYGQDAFDVDQFTWENEECLVVGSSGNWGEKLGSPGIAKNALCVSAAYIDAAGSCFGDGVPGPTEDGRRKPELLAPGCDIISAYAGSACETRADADLGASHDPPRPACSPQSASCAASFATPVVSAAAALVRQYFVEGWYPTGTPMPANALKPSAALVKAMLLNSTARTQGAIHYPSDEEGWGLLQLDRVLNLEQGARKLWIADIRNADGLCTGETASHPIAIAAEHEPLKVTLVWTEPPGQPKATDPVVNNLDLEVTSPDGTATYLGNHFANGESTPGGAPDDRNNVEMILVTRPQPGTWTISVRAPEVNVGSTGQGYALVVTAALA